MSRNKRLSENEILNLLDTAANLEDSEGEEIIHDSDEDAEYVQPVVHSSSDSEDEEITEEIQIEKATSSTSGS